MSFDENLYGPGDGDYDDCYIVYDEVDDSFIDLTDSDFCDDAFDDYTD